MAVPAVAGLGYLPEEEAEDTEIELTEHYFELSRRKVKFFFKIVDTFYILAKVSMNRL